ncbi:hypothetical protein SAMN05892883_1485 [Jatrophihabitans sp. GAS493]|uniref:hypothetical protein n=1 Tax=Jatrophihabitans sp. GAS493 TaxID=1907575 RepID=UPI000BB9BA7F|nr:hypothetical protein [Jatrophihabitans sp. GAS493]SOD72043.1 hypothetical protein SAMN05892883_1485 [Jatrophihabitans sp. GAS493]
MIAEPNGDRPVPGPSKSRPSKSRPSKARLLLGGAGVALIAYGGIRILANSQQTNPAGLAKWLIAAAVIHDGIFVPLVSLIGFGLSRTVRPRARRFVQFALVVGGSLALIAWPEIYREGTQPAAKAWLQQNYTANLYILLSIVGAVTLLGYLATVIRDARADRRRQANDRPPTVNTSST